MTDSSVKATLASNEQLIAIEMKPLEGCAAVLVSFNRPFTHVEMNAMHRALNEHLIPHGIETLTVDSHMERLQNERLTWGMACPCSCDACERFYDVIRAMEDK